MNSLFKIQKISLIDGFVDQYMALFEEVFAESSSIELFSWKYSQTYDFLLAAIDEDALVGFYGLYARKFYNQGRAFNGLQSCDVMVANAQRGKLQNSIFHQLLKGYIRDMSEDHRGFDFLFGFPHKRHMRLGQRTSYYSLGDELQWFDWFKSDSHKVASYSIQNLDSSELDLVDVDAVWLKMKASMATHSLGDRSATYINKRYIKHPNKKYGYLKVQGLQELDAYVIYRLLGKQAFIVDVVSPMDSIAEVLNFSAVYLLKEYALNKVRIAMASVFSSKFFDDTFNIHKTGSSPIAIGNPADVYWDKTKFTFDAIDHNIFLMLGDQESI